MAAYAELAVTSNFSFLRGASHPEELVAQAIALGLSGLGIADRNSLAGIVRAHVFLRENKERAGDFRLVVGARLVFSDGTPDILAYPQRSRRLWPPHAPADLRQSAGAEGRVHPRARRSPRICRRLAAHRDGRDDLRCRHSCAAIRRRSCASIRRLAAAAPGRVWLAAAMTYGTHMRGDLAARAALRTPDRTAAHRRQRCRHARAGAAAGSPMSWPASARGRPWRAPARCSPPMPNGI